MSLIKIEITGGPGSGKTTLGEVILDTLSKAGLNVLLVDDGKQRTNVSPDKLSKVVDKVRAIRDKTSVTIVSKHSRMITNRGIKESANFINNLSEVGIKASEAGTKLGTDWKDGITRKVLIQGSPFPVEFDYDGIEKRIMANFVQTVELATQKINANPSYQITDEEKAAISICSGVNFTVNRIHDGMNFELDDVSVQWNGEKFLVSQKQKGM